METIKNWIIGLLVFALEHFDSSVKDAAELLAGGFTSGITGSSLFNLADMIAQAYIAPFCTTILCICLMIELAIGAAKIDKLRWEDGVKIAVKLCLGKVCIDSGSTLLEAIYLQSQSWISSIGGTATSSMGGTINKSIPDLIDNVTGFGNVIGLLVTSIIMVIAIFVCGLLIKVMAYGRMFEIYAYVVISPLPLAFAPLSGGGEVGVNNITKRFLKTFIGVCLQGVMMLIVLRTFKLIIGNALIDAINDIVVGSSDDMMKIVELLYTMLLGSIALVVSVSKSGSWAKGIVDAG